MRTITISVDTNESADTEHLVKVIGLVLGLSPFTYTIEHDELVCEGHDEGAVFHLDNSCVRGAP